MDVLSLKEGSGFRIRLGCKHSVIYRSYIHMGLSLGTFVTDCMIKRWQQRGFNPSVPGHFCY